MSEPIYDNLGREISEYEQTVWERSMDPEPFDGRIGDRHLRAAVRLDNRVQNGGVFHAIDLDLDAYEDGLAGLRWFGLSEQVAAVERARALDQSDDGELGDDDEEADLDDRYFEAPELCNVFIDRIRAEPESFAP